MKQRGTLAGFMLVTAGLILGIGEDARAFKIVSFDGVPTRWSGNNISYVVSSLGSDNFEEGCDGRGDCISERDAIRASFDTWENIQGVDVRFYEDTPKSIGKTGYDNENSIVWVEKGWQSLPFSPPSSALAVTVSTYKTKNNEIVDSDIHFNGEYFQWGVIDTAEEKSDQNVVDIQNIATHEIGHFIGLDHSSENIFESSSRLWLATMFFASGPGETFRRDLGDDDIDAMANLYPDASRAAPAVDEIYPNTIDLQTQTSAIVTLSGSGFQPFTSVVLALKGDRQDIHARVISADESQMKVMFDVYGLPSGEYDIVVSNSFDSTERIDDGLALSGGIGSWDGENGNGSEYGSSSGGGCAMGVNEVSVSGQELNQSKVLSSGIVLLLLPLLLVFWARLSLTSKRIHQPVDERLPPRRRQKTVDGAY